MLGCHEFCGYYEWTFHYVRRRWGSAAVARLWTEAIGGDSQQHYAEAARQSGLAGLYRTWVKTGEAEACDWTFSLDEQRNVLRWDMRQCPSKGFLLDHDLNADEDYCDHCMGWMVPLLNSVGVEVWQHEHNHRGQCWGTMRLRNRASEPLPVLHDIRLDARWKCGYLDCWEHNSKQPICPTISEACDSCELLTGWFADAAELLVVPERPSLDRLLEIPRSTAGLLSEQVYVDCGDLRLAPLAVLIGHGPVDFAPLAARLAQTETDQQPVLVHPYLPGHDALDFADHGLPRPLPLLPLLIRSGHYLHRPGGPVPSSSDLLIALARALGKPFTIWSAAQGAE